MGGGGKGGELRPSASLRSPPPRERSGGFHQVREVELRYTARCAGPVEDVWACRVFGMMLPLGFAIRGMNRVSPSFPPSPPDHLALLGSSCPLPCRGADCALRIAFVDSRRSVGVSCAMLLQYTLVNKYE